MNRRVHVLMIMYPIIKEKGPSGPTLVAQVQKELWVFPFWNYLKEMILPMDKKEAYKHKIKPNNCLIMQD